MIQGSQRLQIQYEDQMNKKGSLRPKQVCISLEPVYKPKIMTYCELNSFAELFIGLDVFVI